MFKRIVCVTDCVDVASVELRASLLTALDGADVAVEPVVAVDPPFSAINGNFLFRLIADCYPSQTLFMSTIGPLRQRPRAVVGTTADKGLAFIGRDIGVFDWLVRDFGCASLHDISHRYGEGAAFVNFAGRSVTAPLAVKVALGVEPGELGISCPPVVRQLELTPGTVVHVDNFGNLKFSGQVLRTNDGDRYTVTLAGRTVEALFTHRLMSLPDGDFAIYRGSSYGLYELGVARGSAAATLSAAVGDVLHLLPEPDLAGASEATAGGQA